MGKLVDVALVPPAFFPEEFPLKTSNEETPPQLAPLAVAQVHTEATGSKIRSKTLSLSLWLLVLQIPVTAAKTLK